MTLDEAISLLKQYIDYNNPDIPDFYTMEEACEVVIKAFEQKQCGDCISRDAVMHILDEVGGDFDSPREAVVPIDYIADMVAELPSVTPQPKVGKWTHDGSHWENRWICSECGYKLFDEQTRFCPNCGSKMQEVKDES